MLRINCREATERLSLGQDRALTLREKLPLQMHLWVCQGCSRFSQQLGLLRQVARAPWRDDDPRR